MTNTAHDDDDHHDCIDCDDFYYYSLRIKNWFRKLYGVQ